jgi:hypothetical protein
MLLFLALKGIAISLPFLFIIAFKSKKERLLFLSWKSNKWCNTITL